MAYTWQKLANDWDALSDADKIALFEGTAHNVPTGAELMALNEPFKVAIYDVVQTGQHLYIEGIPKRQTIVPNTLISTQMFETIDRISLDFAMSGDGDIKVALTVNLVDYFVYNDSTAQWNLIALSDIDTLGMSPVALNSYGQSVWNKLDLRGGVAFAYSLEIDNKTDEADVDTLNFTGDANGTWVSQKKGDVFDYEYVADNILRVHIYSNGDYKINYKKKNDGGGGGSGDYDIATKAQIDALFI